MLFVRWLTHGIELDLDYVLCGAHYIASFVLFRPGVRRAFEGDATGAATLVKGQHFAAAGLWWVRTAHVGVCLDVVRRCLSDPFGQLR